MSNSTHHTTNNAAPSAAPREAHQRTGVDMQIAKLVLQGWIGTTLDQIAMIRLDNADGILWQITARGVDRGYDHAAALRYFAVEAIKNLARQGFDRLDEARIEFESIREQPGIVALARDWDALANENQLTHLGMQDVRLAA